MLRTDRDVENPRGTERVTQRRPKLGGAKHSLIWTLEAATASSSSSFSPILHFHAPTIHKTMDRRQPVDTYHTIFMRHIEIERACFYSLSQPYDEATHLQECWARLTSCTYADPLAVCSSEKSIGEAYWVAQLQLAARCVILPIVKSPPSSGDRPHHTL